MDILNPERIVIGSVFARSEALFRPAMEAAIEAEALPGTRERCRVVPSALGDLIGDWAALGVVMDRRNRE
jgi:glucokinase